MEEENNAIEFEVTVDPEFEKLIPALRTEELTALEESVLRDGCTAPLIIWKEHGILLDGHNRKIICDKYNVPYKTSELPFDSRENVKRWIIERQFGRRNLMSFQRAELALLLKPMLAEDAKKRMLAGKANPVDSESTGYQEQRTRDSLAKKMRVSPHYDLFLAPYGTGANYRECFETFIADCDAFIEKAGKIRDEAWEHLNALLEAEKELSHEI